MRLSFSSHRTVAWSVGATLTLGGVNMYGWRIYSLSLQLLLWEIELGAHFKRRY